MKDEKRRDKKGRILQMGESQLEDGRYVYKYTDKFGERKAVYSWRLTDSDKTPPGKKNKKSLRELEIDIIKNMDEFHCELTVIEQVDRYLETKIPKSTHNTIAGYKTVQNILSKESFGKRSIQSVKYSDALLFLIRLQDAGRSYSSIHSIRGVLRPAFEMAVRDGMIPSNPFSFQLAEALINDSVRREAISPKQEREFLRFVKEDSHFSRYYEGIYILFKTGLRISEFCGLTISDINFNDHTLTIDHQLQRTRSGEYVIVKPKTKAGVRVLPIDKEVENCFRTIIRKRKSPIVEPMYGGRTGFLFLDKNDQPMISMHWEKYFQHICKKYNKIYRIQMPKVTPHVCRHTYCSNMARRGISAKTLQYLMGHSDISITLNVYTHLGLDDAKSELDRLKNAN